MKTVVQKYGGSSVSTPDKLKAVAKKVLEAQAEGARVAVVVSAMGDTTDHFCDLARQVCRSPSSRELDLLMTAGERISSSLLTMAIQDLGGDAISLTGPQAGIITTDTHNRARILEIRPHRVQAELELGRVVVVAGFQGLSYRGEITTLGRGGSDTSAVALASALQAERCEIYSDVDGIYTSDPRLVPDARRLDEISYREMQEMARSGARVLNADAVEFARQSGLEIRAGSTFEEGPGTLVKRGAASSSQRFVGVTGRRDLFRVKVLEESLAEQMGRLMETADVFHRSANELLLTGENVADLQAFRQKLREQFHNKVVTSPELGSVSVIGSGWDDATPALERMLATLRRERLSPIERYVGEHSLTCLLPVQAVESAHRVLHEAFLSQEAKA